LPDIKETAWYLGDIATSDASMGDIAQKLQAGHEEESQAAIHIVFGSIGCTVDRWLERLGAASEGRTNEQALVVLRLVPADGDGEMKGLNATGNDLFKVQLFDVLYHCLLDPGARLTRPVEPPSLPLEIEPVKTFLRHRAKWLQDWPTEVKKSLDRCVSLPGHEDHVVKRSCARETASGCWTDTRGIDLVETANKLLTTTNRQFARVYVDVVRINIAMAALTMIAWIRGKELQEIVSVQE
jgi:hypothetical protein